MKKVVSLMLAAAMCFGLVGCGTEYEDTNGEDDYTLQTITDENIIALDVGASGLSYSEESLNGAAYSAEYSAKSFNGVERIYFENYILPSDVNVYIGTMNVKSGNFKLAVVNNDEIIHEFALDTFNETFRFEDITGDFSICVAGEDAAFSFYIDVY